MAKFCEYRDLFKWNKALMEDDWNDGQTYVLKTVNKGPGGTVSNEYLEILELLIY